MERRWKTSHIQNLPCCCKELRSIAKQHIQKNRTCRHQLGRRQLAIKATHFCQRQRQLYVFPFPVTIFKYMFKIRDWSLAETSWITTSIGFRVFAEDHRRMEASFGCHWQLTHIYQDFLFMLFNTFYIGSQRTVWFIMVIMNNFVWPYFVLSYIFKVPSIPGRIRNFLNNYPFLLMKRKFVFNRLFPLTWSERIHGAFAKKPPCRMDLSFFETEKDWQKGRTLISYFQSYQSTLLKAVSRGLDSMLREVWPQQLGQQSVPQIWNTIHSAFREIPEEVHLQFLNDDLVSFFNSVPQDRLLNAVQALIVAWKDRHPGDLSISVDLSATGDPIQSTFAGTYIQKISLQRQVHQSWRPLHHCEGQPHQSLFQRTWKYLASNPRSRYWESD